MSHLLFFETSGNQAYLYATNRLKENIGASELTWCCGTRWLLEAVAKAGGPADIWREAEPAPKALRQRLREAKAQNGIEIILATSGKGLLRVDEADKARAIMNAISRRALLEAPGLDVYGVIVDCAGKDFGAAYKEVHQCHQTLRNTQPSPLLRHPMLPGVERCASSGLPASEMLEDKPLAEAIIAKRRAAKDWHRRITALMLGGQAPPAEPRLQLAKDAEALEQQFEQLDWTGVIFADGNGLGQLFKNLDQYLPPEADYAQSLRNFSLAIDDCTEAAFYSACLSLDQRLRQKQEQARTAQNKPPEDAAATLPVVPLVLGGDDLTVLVDGRHALDFTRDFLLAFEQETASNAVIQPLAEQCLGAPRLSACAGVAIIKPHFPYHAAHQLAADLLKSAKLCKQKLVTAKGQPHPCSALDFHVLFDSTFHDLAQLHGRRTVQHSGLDQTYRLHAGPYIVTPAENLPRDENKWVAQHHMAALLRRVAALQARHDDGRRILPSSQMHSLRQALALGGPAADQRCADLRRHYGDALDPLLEDGASLFRQEEDAQVTVFVDALTSSEFWQTQPQESQS